MAKNKGGKIKETMIQDDTKMKKDKRESIEAITIFQREFLSKNKRLPTCKQIAEGTGLSIITIKRRAKEVNFKEVFDTHTSKLGLYTLIHSLYINASKGNIKALDRYFQYAFGIMPAQEFNIKGNLSISSGFEEKLKEVFEKHGESKIDELFKLLNKQ